MKPSAYDNGLQREIINASCEICGSYKSSYKKYCDECEQYKKMADDKKKARARAKAFGDIWK